MVGDQEIAQLLSITDPGFAASVLIAAALGDGGCDKVTCWVADVEDGPNLAHHGINEGAVCNPNLVINPASVRLAPPA